MQLLPQPHDLSLGYYGCALDTDCNADRNSDSVFDYDHGTDTGWNQRDSGHFPLS